MRTITIELPDELDRDVDVQEVSKLVLLAIKPLIEKRVAEMIGNKIQVSVQS